ncbi:MAG TPA: hypothetical protein VIT67_16755, partial [Povalibacter sp.]
MRAAFISLMAGAPWAASEILWAETAQRALDDGHEVFASVLRWPQRPALLESLGQRGAQVTYRSRNRWIRRSALVARAVDLFAALRRFRPDVICLSQGGTYDIARSGSMVELRRV